LLRSGHHPSRQQAIGPLSIRSGHFRVVDPLPGVVRHASIAARQVRAFFLRRRWDAPYPEGRKG